MLEQWGVCTVVVACNVHMKYIASLTSVYSQSPGYGLRFLGGADGRCDCFGGHFATEILRRGGGGDVKGLHGVEIARKRGGWGGGGGKGEEERGRGKGRGEEEGGEGWHGEEGGGEGKKEGRGGEE